MEKKICTLLYALIETIPPDERKDFHFWGEKTILHHVNELIPRIKSSLLREQVENLCNLFNIDFIIFGDHSGDHGELGKAAFMSRDLNVVVTIVFGDFESGQKECFILR